MLEPGPEQVGRRVPEQSAQLAYTGCRATAHTGKEKRRGELAEVLWVFFFFTTFISLVTQNQDRSI